jgi:lipopolysaccharide transport system ATP-binding protein
LKDWANDVITEAVKAPFRGMARRGKNIQNEDNFIWALKDVSFEVKSGEVLGIIGRNGAGKSTLLKVLSKITEPTEGRATIHGRVASLLEVGTGFHPELTGRENIFLNGAILGMSRKEIQRKFDEIVAFSEIGKFLDTPVKRYSSGMYLRLAFAVAAHMEPEILIVDEVLAVGDAQFQKKCLGKMGDIASQGRTVLFVSHNMAAITHFCRWGIWLNGGQVEALANIEDIVDRYLTSGVKECGEISFLDNLDRTPGTEYVRLLGVRTKDRDGKVTSCIDVRHSFCIEIEYQILRLVTNLRIGLTITSSDGTIVLNSKDSDCLQNYQERTPGKYVSACEVPGDFLNYGQYFVSVGSDFPMIQVHFALDRVLAFQVEPTGGVGGSIPDGRRGILRLNLPWVIHKIE